MKAAPLLRHRIWFAQTLLPLSCFRSRVTLREHTLPTLQGIDVPNKGFLLVTMQVPPAFEEEFNAWYDTEHLPERLSVPGFETALRFVCLSGYPRYLAMYDLTSPEVLDSSAYLKIAFANSSPWTRRVLQRVRVYRAAGRQIYPGTAVTGTSPRVQLLRFRSRPSGAAAEIVAGMRSNFEGRPETLQVRALAFEDRGATDFLGFVEQRAPSAPSLVLNAFGVHADAIDLVNTYAPYQ